MAVKEFEIIGDLTKESWKKFIKIASENFGKPIEYRRLALMVFNRVTPGINTRVRITWRGTEFTTELMQKIKIKVEDGASHKLEIDYPLPSDVDSLYNAYTSYMNILKEPARESLISVAVQHYSKIWDIEFEGEKYELKITRQPGNGEIYNFECELVEGTELRMKSFLEKYNFEKDFDHHSVERLDIRINNDITISDKDESFIKKLITEYIEKPDFAN